MYITVDDIKNEISLDYPIDNRNGDKKVGLIRSTSFTVSITLKRMKRSTLRMVNHYQLKEGVTLLKT